MTLDQPNDQKTSQRTRNIRCGLVEVVRLDESRAVSPLRRNRLFVAASKRRCNLLVLRRDQRETAQIIELLSERSIRNTGVYTPTTRKVGCKA